MKRLGLIFAGLAVAGAAVVAALVEPATSSAVTEHEMATLVYQGPHGKKYHAQECQGLKHTRATQIASLTRSEAEARGLEACRSCFKH